MARTPRLLAVAALLALLLVAPSSAFAAKTIGLSAGTFAFTVDAGAVGEGAVEVMNDGDEPLKALVYVADVKIDDKGGQTYVPPQREGAALLSTPASWFRIFMPADSKSVGNTPYIELEPGERIPIRFEFSPPQGTPPGDHNAMIFFEMFDLDGAGAESSARVGGRIGARVALRVNGEIVDKMQIRPFVVPGFVIGRETPFSFTLRNDGNVDKRVTVMASLLNRDERAVAEAVVATDTAVYAGSARQLSGVLASPGGRIGPHTVEVTVEYRAEGAQTPVQLVEKRTVWLLPYWLIVFAGFVVAYLVAYIVYRLRRRHPRRGGGDKAGRVEEPSSGPDGRGAGRVSRQSRRSGRNAEAEERRRAREERAARWEKMIAETRRPSDEE